MRLAIVGTELARLSSSPGALERIGRSWATNLAGCHQVVVVETARRVPGQPCALGAEGQWEVLESSPSDLVGDLQHLSPAVAVVSNRPAWASQLPMPTLCVLHNYPAAWGLEPGELAGLRRAGAFRGVAFAAVSPTLARASALALGLAPTAVAVVPPPLEPAFLDHDEPSHPSPAEPGLFLFPHRLLRKKGLELALRALDALEDPDVELVAFAHLSPWQSPTEEHRALARAVAAAPRASLHDPVGSPAEMARWMRRAEVVLCPSTEPEGLCMAALEAQAVGTPVVATRMGGLQDALVAPNELVAPGHPAALAAAVERARRRRSDPAAAQAAASTVASRHHPARSATRFLALVEAAAGATIAARANGIAADGLPALEPDALVASSGHGHDRDHDARPGDAPQRP